MRKIGYIFSYKSWLKKEKEDAFKKWEVKYKSHKPQYQDLFKGVDDAVDKSA